jgi:hypothetical protein
MEETVQKYYETKEKIRDLEVRLAKYKSLIERSMKEPVLETSKYTIRIKTTKVERMNKGDCPSDVWSQYAKKSTYTSLDVKKKERAIEKSV